VNDNKPERERTYLWLLKSLEDEVVKHGQFVTSQTDFDVYMATLKSSFVKAYDFARFAHRVSLRRANESSFFMTAGLRGICEDIIALKFIAQFTKPIRQELMLLEMQTSVRKASDVQTKFFRRERPFQPIVTSTPNQDIRKEKQQYTTIGARVGFCMIKDKLPAIEQMATPVGLREIYDYFYRITSETVHFNVRVALRNGWGELPGTVQFGTKNFCRYYLSLNQTYGVFLFCLMSETFSGDLGLTPEFLQAVAQLRRKLDRELRWPEPVTFEEMNLETPSPILTSALLITHLEKTDPEYIKRLDKKLKRKRKVLTPARRGVHKAGGPL